MKRILVFDNFEKAIIARSLLEAAGYQPGGPGDRKTDVALGVDDPYYVYIHDSEREGALRYLEANGYEKHLC